MLVPDIVSDSKVASPSPSATQSKAADAASSHTEDFTLPIAGSSGTALPSFEQSAADPIFNFDGHEFTIPRGGEEPPPEFIPYEAEYSIAWDGSIVSHDPHLNEDGEALYRFLLARAQEHPEYVLHCRGTHDEHRDHHQTYTDSQGHTRTRTETRVETVIDFDFKINVAQELLSGTLLWTIPDNEPAYRGGRVKTTKDGEIASRASIKALKELQKYRDESGYPPWIGRVNTDGPGVMNFDQQFNVLQSSWTLRQWADDYCASDKIFKEFVFEKMIYGWKIDLLLSAVRSAIQSTYYQGNVNVHFQKRLAKVVIRRDTNFQRLLSHLWFKILLWVTLIYPFLWLFQRFHPNGYGKWTVGGSAHAFTRFYRHGPPPVDQPAPPQLVHPEGVREGEWFRIWEGTIRRMAASRVRSSQITMTPDVNAAALLDGGRNNLNAFTYFGA